MPDDKSLPSIAVVAVHGVGEHERGASARSIADLLLRLRHTNGDVQYTSFRETPIRIPTHPAVVAPKPKVTKRGSLFDELSHYLRDELASSDPTMTDAMPSLTERPPTAAEAAQGAGGGRSTYRSSESRWGRYAPEYDFMRGQLEDYSSSGDPYDTLRLDGHPLPPSRPNDTSRPSAVVHIYEMYWSDLSRLGTSLLSIFGELYQLLFHVAHLSRQAIEHALVEYKDDRAWRWYASSTQWAVRLLTVFVPVSWLTMLTTVLGILILAVPNERKPVVVAVIAGLAVFGAVWRKAYRSGGSGPLAAFLWPLIPLSGSTVGGLLWWWMRSENASQHPAHADRLMLVTWMFVAGALLWLTYRAYQKVRPGVRRIGMIAYAAALLATVWVISTESATVMSARTTNVFEVETVGVVVIWYSLYLVATVAAVLGIWNRRRLHRALKLASPSDAPRLKRQIERASHAGWTARTTIALSSATVLLLTFVLWAATLKASSAVVPDALKKPYTPFFPRFFGGTESYNTFFANVIGATAGAGFPIVLIVMALLGLVLLLAFLPAVLQELSAPRTGEQFQARPTSPKGPDDNGQRSDAWLNAALDGDRAERLGRWLSFGYGVLTISVVLLFAAVFILQPAASILHWLLPNDFPILGALQSNAHDLILTLGTLLATTSVGVVVISRRLEALALGFRPMLDAALDVDNYLREHPRERTPRARIIERYVSLLRYLVHWRDGKDQPYRAIIIVSHSQGTVISADLLGFLQVERDPEIAGTSESSGHRTPPLLLFTMGSPLRQLYGFSFPHLYRWISDPTAAWGGRPRARGRPPRFGGPTPSDELHVVTPPYIPDNAVPDPADLGLTRWVNAYRSGDYVGRALWRTDIPGLEWMYRSAPSDAKDRLAPEGANAEPATFVTEDLSGSRRELCLGAGAHTHYWDATARAVALELDRLIRHGLVAPSAPVAAPKSAYAPGQRGDTATTSQPRTQ